MRERAVVSLKGETMARKRCPGMDPAGFGPEDIRLRACLACGEEQEFWRDDVKLTCPSCGHVNFNPDIGSTCLVWCKSAAQCLGNEDVKDWLARKLDQDRKKHG